MLLRRAHDLEEPRRASDYDNWSRHRQSVFQIHGIDAEGNVTLRRRVKGRYVLAFFQKLPPCLVGIEACASSHHWSRELQARGHTVRLMPPAYVKPYVKRHKNDAVDAEAICEAVTRANMRFVATKTPEQQSCPPPPPTSVPPHPSSSPSRQCRTTARVVRCDDRRLPDVARRVWPLSCPIAS